MKKTNSESLVCAVGYSVSRCRIARTAQSSMFFWTAPEMLKNELLLASCSGLRSQQQRNLALSRMMGRRVREITKAVEDEERSRWRSPCRSSGLMWLRRGRQICYAAFWTGACWSAVVANQKAQRCRSQDVTALELPRAIVALAEWQTFEYFWCDEEQQSRRQ